MYTFKKNLFAAVLLTAATFAATALPSTTGNHSRAVKKAIETVEKAEAYDWKTLAECAEICFKKGENVSQALEWINRSIEINEDPYNLEIKGDYYESEGDKQEAMKYYYKAIVAGKAQNFWNDNDRLQEKIWDLR